MASCKVFVAGHRGMVGSAIVRQLKKDPSNEIIVAARSELDLTDQVAVNKFFAMHKFDQVYLAAAKVGGIHANNAYPADFIYENLMIQANVIQAAHKADVHKLLFLGSSCIYPRLAEQPISESALLTGALEPTNEPYAIAKIAGIKLCESYNRQHGRDYRSIMPTNLYGPGDNYHPLNSHVIPALIRKFHAGLINKSSAVVVWGSGQPRREFLHVDDLARAAISIMLTPFEMHKSLILPEQSHINVGVGEDFSISEIVNLIAEIVGYSGEVQWDTTKPDGAPRKLMDVSILRSLGWVAEIRLADGLASTYKDYVSSGERLNYV